MPLPLPPMVSAAMRLAAFRTGTAVLGSELLDAAEETSGAQLGEKNIEMTVPVSSSCIRSIGFHAGGIITVDFVRGGSYDYPGSEELFMAFLTAPSKGAFFNAHFR